ncbi:hypothetical protein DFH29DRAFT_888715 [Suillus ampliporus]|nr:hypothetical protein DFH29DRAFT_888715 [Suillus ampliporus]
MASTGIPLDSAAIISTVLEGILYGFSVLMFIGTMWALSYKRAIRDINRPIAVVAILLLILSTVHLVVDIIRIEDGLVKYGDTFPGGPTSFFQEISQWTFVTKNEIYFLHTLLGDGVVIYRCHVVWKSVWVIVLPSILWCGAAVTGFIAPYYASQATGGKSIYTDETGQWVTAFFVFTISTNLISSGLLAYRIWAIECETSKIRATKGTTTYIVRVLVDAALMYSAALFSTLILFARSNNGQYVMLDMIVPIISIAFYMVLIRITLKKVTRNHLSTVYGVTISETERTNAQQYPMEPLQIHISQLTHTDSASHGAGNQDRALKLTCNAGSMEGASCDV